MLYGPNVRSCELKQTGNTANTCICIYAYLYSCRTLLFAELYSDTCLLNNLHTSPFTIFIQYIYIYNRPTADTGHDVG